MVTIDFMERLLMVAAEAESLFSDKNRRYERPLKEELSKIIGEAELLIGPRDSSYELLEPRITDACYATPAFYPPRKVRIYLTKLSKTARHMAAYELSHEVVHVLSPVRYGESVTVLEEGLASYFSFRYVERNYGVQFESTGDPHYDEAMRGVEKLLTKNEFVIKELRVREPVISRIDERLLVDVAGADVDLAKFLCRDFPSYRNPPIPLGTRATQNAQLFAKGLQSIWDDWKSVAKS